MRCRPAKASPSPCRSPTPAFSTPVGSAVKRDRAKALTLFHALRDGNPSRQACWQRRSEYGPESATVATAMNGPQEAPTADTSLASETRDSTRRAVPVCRTAADLTRYRVVDRGRCWPQPRPGPAPGHSDTITGPDHLRAPALPHDRRGRGAVGRVSRAGRCPSPRRARRGSRRASVSRLCAGRRPPPGRERRLPCSVFSWSLSC